jgi:hypothetical protein
MVMGLSVHRGWFAWNRSVVVVVVVGVGAVGRWLECDAAEQP